MVFQLYFLIALLEGLIDHTNASLNLWQCKPGTVDLNEIYPELIRESGDDILGEGIAGRVVRTNSSTPTIVKRFFPETAYSDIIYHEYWVGHTVTHPSIAKSHSLRFVTAEPDGYWEMEAEYIPFPLFDILDYDRWAERKWSIDAITCLFAQVMHAVAHLHEHGVAHRDLKVENILVARDGTIKVIDFGSSGVSRDLLAQTQLKSWANWIGTPATMAPEAHGELFYDMQMADVWSLGVILVRLWLGEYPWRPECHVGALMEDEAFLTFVEELASDAPCEDDKDDSRLLCQIPQAMRDVVAGMLTIDPERRMSLHSVLGYVHSMGTGNLE